MNLHVWKIHISMATLDEFQSAYWQIQSRCLNISKGCFPPQIHVHAFYVKTLLCIILKRFCGIACWLDSSWVISTQADMGDKCQKWQGFGGLHYTLSMELPPWLNVYMFDTLLWWGWWITCSDTWEYISLT